MKNDVLVSVIVPVYNVEKYLHECIDSIIAQTYKNIEILLIDDGSTDKSSSICDKWQKKDNRIKAYHQENLGVSAARNKGLNMAQGDYIIFVDGDDVVSNDMCKLMLECALDTNADIVMSDYLRVPNKNFTNHNCYDKDGNQKCVLMNLEETIYKITDINYQSGINAVTKIYKSNIAKNHRFMEGYPLGEDQEYVFACIHDSHVIGYLNCITYYYISRNDSAVNQQLTISRAKKLIELYDKITTKYSDEIHVHDRLLTYRICQCEMTILNRCISIDMNDELVHLIQKNIIDNISIVWESDYSLSKKIQICFAGIAPKAYVHMIRILKRKRGL